MMRWLSLLVIFAIASGGCMANPGDTTGADDPEASVQSVVSDPRSTEHRCSPDLVGRAYSLRQRAAARPIIECAARGVSEVCSREYFACLCDPRGFSGSPPPKGCASRGYNACDAVYSACAGNASRRREEEQFVAEVTCGQQLAAAAVLNSCGYGIKPSTALTITWRGFDGAIRSTTCFSWDRRAQDDPYFDFVEFADCDP